MKRFALDLRAVSLVLLALAGLSLTFVGHVVSGTARKPSAGMTRATLRGSAEAHGVRIGAAVDPAFLKEAEYARILAAEFNEIEPENAMKFGPVHPRPNTDPHPYDFDAADQVVAFAKQHDMPVRGHTLVWHNQVADWVGKGNYSPEQLNAILKEHITAVVKHFGASVYAYDVVNEAFMDDGTMRSTIWYDKPGIGFAGQGSRYVAQALKWAHEANPQALLFYNDYSNEPVNARSDTIYAMAKDFKVRGVPLDGIGFQMHVDLSFDDAAKLKSMGENIKRLSDLGLIVHITELDVRIKSNDAANLAAQAKLYGEIVGLCLQQPSCKLIQMWGVTDKHSWIPGVFKGYGWALLWDDNYAPKPAYDAFLKALVP